MKSLARRSVTSGLWNVGANGIVVVVSFVRSVLLARLLAVEAFGIYGFAAAIAGLSAVVLEFGLNGAFLHRAEETEDEAEAAAVHFTLKLMLTTVWSVLMAGGAVLFTEGEARAALLVLTGTAAGTQLVHTPTIILTRRVVHRRLSLIQVCSVLAMTGTALVLAWRGAGVWALLSTDIASLAVSVLLLYGWRPVWRPRLAWRPAVVRYYLSFGSRNIAAGILNTAIGKVDDLWTGIYLGEVLLGFYSRAYRFARYPSSIIAAPINSVVGGTYAELKSNRLGLSRAFFRTNAFLVRAGFFLAGLLFLVAPEFIRLLLGEKWMPMLNTFRLMLLFTLLDPLQGSVARLYIAVGKPEQLMWTRVVQLLVLAVGLFSLGMVWGIAGVALAVDVMVVIGIGLLLWQARAYVDFDYRRVFFLPGLAVGVGIVLGRLAILLPGMLANDWRSGGVKVAVFVVCYGGILVIGEGREIRQLVRWARGAVVPGRVTND